MGLATLRTLVGQRPVRMHDVDLESGISKYTLRQSRILLPVARKMLFGDSGSRSVIFEIDSEFRSITSLLAGIGFRLREGDTNDFDNGYKKAVIGRWTNSYESGVLVSRYGNMHGLAELAMGSLANNRAVQFNAYKKAFDESKIPLDLTGVDLRRISCTGEDDRLVGFDFSNLIMRHAVLRGVQGSKLSFRGADMSHSDARCLRLEDSNLSDADVTGAHFESGYFASVKLALIKGTGVHFQSALFYNSAIEKGRIDLESSFFFGAVYNRSGEAAVEINTFQDILNLRL
ncbi:MAG: pentapeptide repeat-containing protein [Candidatus Margulisiibacteriota bacterium]